MKIHEKAIIHNDIKPCNISWEKFKNSQLIEKYNFF